MNSLSKLQCNLGFQYFVSYFKKFKLKSFPNAPFILLDGGLSTSHNIILNMLMGLAANKEEKLNVGHLTGVHEASIINYLMEETLGSKEINFYKYAGRKSVIWRYRIEKFKFLLYKRHQKLLEYKIEEILVGDLIYDTIIRFHNDIFTVDKIGHREKKIIYETIHRYYVYKEILKEYNIKYIILSHKYYMYFGIMPRLILKNNGIIFSESRGHIKRLTTFDEFMKNDFVFDKTFLNEISKIDIAQIEQFIDDRFNGRIDQHDVKNAYTNKVHYSREEIVAQLKLNPALPIATILPHAFSDAPHCHRFMIYDDYYGWFIDTLRIIEGIPNINWLIKPHPSAALYFEDGVVNNILAGNSSNNIKLLPSDIHTESVFKLSDTVVTIRGTVGLEAVLYDIKPIISGDAVYSDLGITTNCKTKKEYEKALNSIQFKVRLDPEDIRKAKFCLYWWHGISLPPLGIVPNEIVPNLPEETVLKHDMAAYEIASAFLKESGHEKDIYFIKLCEFFRRDKNRLSGLDFLKNEDNSAN